MTALTKSDVENKCLFLMFANQIKIRATNMSALVEKN